MNKLVHLHVTSRDSQEEISSACNIQYSWHTGNGVTN